MHIPKRNGTHDDAFKDRRDLTQILIFSPEQAVAVTPAHPSTSTSVICTAIDIHLQIEKRRLQVSDSMDSESSSI